MKYGLRDKYTEKCGAERADGKPCQAYAIRGNDPPRCSLHSLSAEERSDRARKAGRARQAIRRSQAEPKPRLGLSPTVSLEDILRACAPALEATFEHNGEPDWGARLAAAGTLVLSFPRGLRDSPEHVQELLGQILPEHVIEQSGMRERLGKVYYEMRREWDKLKIRHNPLTGLYIEEYPAAYIAPWEDRRTVLASRQTPQGNLRRTENGSLLLERQGQPPLLVLSG